MNWYRRTYHVGHSRDGFQLTFEDEHLAYTFAENAIHYLLTALGDPCCGEGPLAKVHVSYRTLLKLGITFGQLSQDDIDAGEEMDQDENALDLFWFRLLNLSGRLYRLNRQVLVIPLTDEQAAVMRPDIDDWFTAGPLDKDDDREYSHCCYTGLRLGGGWHSYGCANFQGHTLEPRVSEVPRSG